VILDGRSIVLKYIATVTLLVNQLASVEAPYRDELGYQPVHRGVISAEQAALWAAPDMAGRPFVILQPAGGRPVYLRFIEDPVAAPPAAGTTFGWNAIENLVQDPDALVRQFAGTAFNVVGPPKDLWQAPGAPRAMQAIGPAREFLYFTRVIPSGFPIPMMPAATPVDRVFIMVVGGPSMAAMQGFYGKTLGLTVGKASEWQITVLSLALGLPVETTYPLAVASMAKDFLVELDEYPPPAMPRPVRPGSLPAGPAMVSFGVEDLADYPLEWRAPPARIAEFPYNGQEAAVAVGPAGEWVELVEIAGLPATGD
jgi:catechol 2,3-dioxygenase-like lactoylglutathione lyase family enzyme